MKSQLEPWAVYQRKFRREGLVAPFSISEKLFNDFLLHLDGSDPIQINADLAAQPNDAYESG